MNVTYDTVAPLVAKTEDNASYLYVTFRCPATGAEVTAEGSWGEDGLVKSEAKRTKRVLFSTIRNSIAATVQTAAGTSAVSRIAGNAAENLVYSAGNDIGKAPKRSDKDREAATLAAFATVADQFRWDEKGKRYVHSGAAQAAASPFGAHVAAHALTEDYDRDVLTRLLASVVAADGKIGTDEKAAFAQLAPGADLTKLAKKKAPTAVDFEETMQGPTRETILLLGWAVMLSDADLAAREEALLATAATGLGIGDDRAAELKKLAQVHIVETAIASLAAAGHDADEIREVVEPLGEGIGLGADEAARAVIRWKKRTK